MGPHDRDQFDDLLDVALKQYGEVEPRSGLEGRVLARLAGASRQPHWWPRWAWLAVAVTVCAAMVAVILTRTAHLREQSIAVRRSVGRVNHSVSWETPPVTHRDPIPAVVQRKNMKPELAQARQPSEFPSRRPLSEQEMMLVEYVQEHPQEALLVAKEQNEFEKRVEQAEKDIDTRSSSDQEER